MAADLVTISQLVNCSLFILLISKQFKIIFLPQQLNLNYATRHEKRNGIFAVPVSDTLPIGVYPWALVKAETNVLKYVLKLKSQEPGPWEGNTASNS